MCKFVFSMFKFENYFAFNLWFSKHKDLIFGGPGKFKIEKMHAAGARFINCKFKCGTELMN